MTSVKSRAVLSAKVEGITYVTGPDVAASVIYTGTFEGGTADGWTQSDGTLTSSTDFAHSGTRSLRHVYDPDTGTPLGDAKRTFTGLTSGLGYTVSVWVRSNRASGTFALGVTGKSATTTTLAAINTWYQRTYTFTATATSHEVYLRYQAGPSATTYWDDITLTRNAYTPTVPDLPLSVVRGDITLSDSRAPYAEARITVSVPAEEYLEQIDPADSLRLVLTAEQEWDYPARSPETRTFNLILQSVRANAESGLLELTAASDEVLLIDGALVANTVSTAPEANQASLRAIINGILSGYSASLAAGTADADFTITDPTVRTNLALNPRVFSATTGWTGTGATVTRLTGQTIPGLSGVSTVARGTMTAVVGGLYNNSDTTSPYALVTPGTQYRISVWLRSSVAKTIQPSAQFTGGTTQNGSTVALAANTWTYVSWVATAPAGSTRVGPYWYSTAAWAAGNTLDATGLTITATSTSLPFFDGATTDAYYTYAWTGTAHASASTRTRVDSRSTDILKLEPGVSYWDFLNPLVRQSGYRLFCDEARTWRLVDSDYTVDGTVTVSEGFNASQGTDSRDLRATNADGSPVAYTAAVIKYVWTDALGVQQTRYDSAGSGTGRKVYRLTEERAYPGPGQAQAILNRAAGRGRTQNLTALLDLTATPGMALVSTLPSIPIVTGQVSAVTLHFDAEGDSHGLMDIDSTGLTETPANAWLFALGTWSAATGTWAAATGTN